MASADSVSALAGVQDDAADRAFDLRQVCEGTSANRHHTEDVMVAETGGPPPELRFFTHAYFPQDVGAN